MCEDEFFDEELDLCLSLLSEENLEPNLYELLSMKPNQWINVKEFILPNENKLSNNIETMWFCVPETINYSAVYILFINKTTLETVNGIYYNYNKLKKQHEFDGYYNIDFEHEFSLSELKTLLTENFPTSNIVVRSFYEDETIEHFYNHDEDKFDVCMDVEYLKTDGVYDFGDVKTCVKLQVWRQLQVPPWQVMEFLQVFSKKMNTKIYVLITDVEKVSFSCSDFSFWCIDNDKRKVVFETEAFYDNPKNVYQDYIPF